CPGTYIWHCPEWEAAPSQGDRPMREAPTEPPEMLTPPGPPPTAKMRTRTCPQEVPPAKSREAPTDSREAPADRTTAMVSHPVEDLPATKAEDRVAAACSRSASWTTTTSTSSTRTPTPSSIRNSSRTVRRIR